MSVSWAACKAELQCSRDALRVVGIDSTAAWSAAGMATKHSSVMMTHPSYFAPSAFTEHLCHRKDNRKAAVSQCERKILCG